MRLERAATSSLAARIFTPGSGALALLRAAWPLAVGPELARRTEVSALEVQTLRIHVPDARWRKALHRMREDILVRLRQIAGDVAPRHLGFIEGLVPPAPEPPPAAALRAGASGPPPPRPDLTAAASAIEDPEIRDRFLEAAARYLDRVRDAPQEGSCEKP